MVVSCRCTQLPVTAAERLPGFYWSSVPISTPRVTDGQTPLFYATCLGRTETCRFFLKGGADLKSVSLHRLAWTASAEIVEPLLEQGADVSIKNKLNRTTLEEISEMIDAELAYDRDSVFGMRDWLEIQKLLKK
jgi:hypothetical protein